MNIVNITIEFDEREKIPGYSWGNYEDWEMDCFGILKMNGIPIFETQINAYYKDPEEVIRAFAKKIAND